MKRWSTHKLFLPMWAKPAMSRRLNTVFVGLWRLHVHGPGFNPRNSRVIQPKITNMHALRLILREERGFDSVHYNL